MYRVRAFLDRSFRKTVLQGSNIYWDVLHALTQIHFFFSRTKFSLRERLTSSKESAAIFFLLVRWAASGGLTAVLIFVALRSLDNYGFSNSEPTNTGVMVSLYGVLAQIVGLILGLYFTSMSVVISTIYSKVPDNVRSLIAREKLGDKFTGALGLLGAISIFEMGLILTGYPPSNLVLYFSLLLTLVAITTLPVLIHNIFHFFDPARLATAYIFPECFNWARRATCGRPGWNNASFQYHFYKQVNQRLVTHRNIVDLLLREAAPNNVSLTRIMAIELSFLSEYVKIKGEIPSDSRWYEYQTEHPRWFDSSSSVTDIALRTSMSLPHRQVPNKLWVEQSVARNLRLTLSHLLRSNDLEHAVEILQHLQSHCTSMVQFMALKEAYFLNSVSDALILEYLSSVASRDADRSHQLALSDFYGANHVNIPIEYGKILQEVSPLALREKLSAIDWRSSVSAYKAKLPVSTLPYIEDMLKKKQNQFIVDSSIAVPIWYDLELIAIACLTFLHEAAEEVTAQYERAFTEKLRAISDSPPALNKMQILSRGLEGYSKCSTFLGMAETLDKELHTLILVEDIPHPTCDWGNYLKRIDDVRHDVIEHYGTLASTINPDAFDSSIPDYLGHAYWLFARECFTALCDDDEVWFRKTYSIYMILMNNTRAYFASRLSRDKNMEYNLTIFSEIFLDAMALGGYAKLFSEFRSGAHWDITVEIWDLFCGTAKRGGHDFLEAFLSIAKYNRRTLFHGMTNRNIERTGWELQYNEIVENELGISEIDYHYPQRSVKKRRDRIESALVRTFGASSLYHAESVFIYCYVLPNAAQPAEVSVDWKTEQFIRSVERTLKNDRDDDGS